MLYLFAERQKYLKDDRHVAEVQHYTGEDEKYAKMLLEENSDCIDAGITDIGENKPQELSRKYEMIGDKVRYHLIGTFA